MIEIWVNGEAHRLPGHPTVADVVSQLTSEPRGVAVALDGTVIPRTRWTATPVVAGARIEVLTAVQGG